MMQLTYNETFDPYHAIFRFVRLHYACDISVRTPFDTLRILDFYLLFPFRIQAMRLFSDDTAWRKISKSYEDRAPYGSMPDDITVFSYMEPFQRAAVSSLVRSGHLVANAWDMNEIQFTKKQLPKTVTLRCTELNDQMKPVVEILCQLKTRYPLSGRDGLKDRTGLLEYRYDSI